VVFGDCVYGVDLTGNSSILSQLRQKGVAGDIFVWLLFMDRRVYQLTILTLWKKYSYSPPSKTGKETNSRGHAGNAGNLLAWALLCCLTNPLCFIMRYSNFE